MHGSCWGFHYFKCFDACHESGCLTNRFPILRTNPIFADSIATKRFDAQTGADREVQRILLELLNQMDGFDQQTNVKVLK